MAVVAPGELEGWGCVDEGRQSEGVGGLGVGDGLVVSSSLAWLGTASPQPGPAAAVGVGAETGVLMDLIVECSVNSPVKAVEDIGADLLAQVLGCDGAGTWCWRGPTLWGRRVMVPSEWRW